MIKIATLTSEAKEESSTLKLLVSDFMAAFWLPLKPQYAGKLLFFFRSCMLLAPFIIGWRLAITIFQVSFHSFA